MLHTVTVTNTRRRPVDVVLDHPAFRTAAHGHVVTSQPTARRNRDGSVVAGRVRRSLPGSVRIPALGSVEGLHPAFRNCSQVRALEARGDLLIVDVHSGEAPLSPPADPAVTSTRRRARAPEPPPGD